LAYATTTSTPTNSKIEFLNTASINNITSKSNGGAFYINNDVMDILMNTPITFTNGLVQNGKGGVFYITKARNVEIQDSTFVNFSSSSSGSFLYSIATTLNLTLINN
jgi:hypothetical protein